MGYKANHYRYINNKVVMMIKPSCGNCLNNEHLYCNMVTRMWMCRILTFSGKHGSLKPKNLSLEDDIPFRRSSFFLGFSVATLGDTDLPYLQNRIWFDGVDMVILGGSMSNFRGAFLNPKKTAKRSPEFWRRSTWAAGHVARREAETEISVGGGAVRGRWPCLLGIGWGNPG